MMKLLLRGTMAIAFLGSSLLSAEEPGRSPDRSRADCPCLYEAIQEETGEDKEADHGESRPAPNTREKAFEIDSRIAAKKFGWDLGKTREHMRNQDKFSVLVAQVNEKNPDVFAGSAMARNPGEDATIWIKGEAPSYAKEMAERFMRETKMRVRIVDGMRYSERDQENRMDRISEALEKQGFHGVGAAMLPGDIIVVSMLASDRFPETPTPKNLADRRFDRDYRDPAAEKLLPDEFDKRGIYFAFTSQPISHLDGFFKSTRSAHQCGNVFTQESSVR